MSTSNEEQPYNKWEFKWDKKKVLALVITILVVTSMICYVNYKTSMRTTEARAQFVISEWDYDNGYGEGIEVMYISENSTGSWVGIYSDPAYTLWNDARPLELNHTVNTAIRIAPYVNFNHTLRGISENTTAFNLMRVSIAVYVAGTLTFSQQNLTWADAVYDDTPTTWSFGCWVIIPILITGGTIYTVSLSYEVFEVVEE